MSDLERLVNEQAEDEGLWFIARTAPEAYLQQELRRLHEVVESALAALAEPDEPAVGRWSRGGWHHLSCWRAWTAAPDRAGCTCG